MLPSSLKISESSTDVVKRLLPPFVRRIVDYREIDLQFTLSQFYNLLFDPKAVYKAATYHHQTQGRWARDDPGFLVLEATAVAFVAILYYLALEPFSASTFLLSIAWALVHFFAVASLISTLLYWITNTYLTKSGITTSTPAKKPYNGSSLDPSSSAVYASNKPVEWWYCFDVHCNSFFPYFVLTRIGQFTLLAVLYSQNILVILFSGAFYFAAFSYYIYITFLGYFNLPFLQHTEKLLLWFVGTEPHNVHAFLMSFSSSLH